MLVVNTFQYWKTQSKCEMYVDDKKVCLIMVRGSTLPGWGDGCPVFLGLTNYKRRGSRIHWSPFLTVNFATFLKVPDVATEGLQERCDIDLLEGFLTVVHGCQDVLGADVIRLLQAAVQACRTAERTVKLNGTMSFDILDNLSLRTLEMPWPYHVRISVSSWLHLPPY